MTFSSTTADLNKVLRLARRPADYNIENVDVSLDIIPAFGHSGCPVCHHMPRKAGSNVFHCTSCMVKDFGLVDIHEDKHKTVVERTGTMPFTPLEYVENMGKGDVLPHIYAFDAESLAYVTLWVTARYDEGRLVESTEPALSKWINKTTTPKMLTALRKKGLYGPKATSSHHPFLSVYFYFYHAVGGNTFMIKDLRHIYLQRAPSYERRKPDDLFDHFRQYIDYALQQIGHLTEVERAQQQIQVVGAAYNLKIQILSFSE